MSNNEFDDIVKGIYQDDPKFKKRAQKTPKVKKNNGLSWWDNFVRKCEIRWEMRREGRL